MQTTLLTCCLLLGLSGQYPPEWLPRPNRVPPPPWQSTPTALVELIENSDLVLKRDLTIGAVEDLQFIPEGSSKRVALHFIVPPDADRRTYPKGSRWHCYAVISKRGESFANWTKVLQRPALAVAAPKPAPNLLWSPAHNVVVTREDVELLFEIVPKPPKVVVLK